MSEFLKDNIKEQVRQAFAGLANPVEILYFTSTQACETCQDTRQLLEEVAALSPQISLSVHSLEEEAELAHQYRIDKAPAFAVVARDGESLTDTGVQYAGIPSGHEFTTLIQDIVLVAGRDSGLKPETRAFLQGLQQPVHLQIFVTPTCPYCPRAVLLAHQMAMENPAMIRAEGIEATEFQELAESFNVSGVPQTTINSGRGVVVGAVPEAGLLAEIQRIAA
jgi:glutaredoxin-like protein